jgi:hypothetical protein
MIGATNAMTSSRSPDCPERYLTVFPAQPKSVDRKLEVITHRQLVLLASSVHLQEALAAQPATQADLTNAMSTVTTTLEHLALNKLAGVGKQVQGQLWKDFSSQAAQVNKLCD